MKHNLKVLLLVCPAVGPRNGCSSKQDHIGKVPGSFVLCLFSPFFGVSLCLPVRAIQSGLRFQCEDRLSKI